MAERCGKTVGSRPWWVGVDQYDPCCCILAPGHDDDCACEHTMGDETPGTGDSNA